MTDLPRKPLARGLGRALYRRRRVRNGVIQLAYILVALTLGFLLPTIETGRQVPAERTFQLAIAVGASVITFTGVVYSLLFLVVQFGTTTYTPRLNLFRDSALISHTFAYFMALFVYGATLAFAVGDESRVSGLLPLSLGVFVTGGLLVFRQLQVTAFGSIQLASVLEQVKVRGLNVIDGVYPDLLDESEPSRTDVAPPAAGVTSTLRWTRQACILQAVDVPELLKIATTSGLTIDWRTPVGRALFPDDEIATIAGPHEPSADVRARILATVQVGVERTFEQDPELAIRVLADIALRALSSAIHDPTTATQALYVTEALLRDLMRRHLDVGGVRDDDDVLRLRLPIPQWPDYVALATQELIHYSNVSIQVDAYLSGMLVRLSSLATQDRRAPIDEALASLQSHTRLRSVPAV